MPFNFHQKEDERKPSYLMINDMSEWNVKNAKKMNTSDCKICMLINQGTRNNFNFKSFSPKIIGHEQLIFKTKQKLPTGTQLPKFLQIFHPQ